MDPLMFGMVGIFLLFVGSCLFTGWGTWRENRDMMMFGGIAILLAIFLGAALVAHSLEARQCPHCGKLLPSTTQRAQSSP